MEMDSKRRSPRAVVVGGSIAGLSCAAELIAAGWAVTVVEKSAGPPAASSTGAGLGLDPQAWDILRRWISLDELLRCTLPLSIDENRATDSETKMSRTLVRDESYGFRAAHWADLHSLIHSALPPNAVLWGHQFLSFEVSAQKSSVSIRARVLRTDEVVEIVGDLLVAADGCLSSVRNHFLPHFKLRYSGYYAWRGVLDFSGKEDSDTIVGIRRAYPDLGDCIYFDLAHGTHAVLYELNDKRLNWIWYVNSYEPELKGSSVTIRVSNDMVERMHKDAEKVWIPELVKVMKETSEPFINLIYDTDPLPQLFWDNVVLVGDAAHPSTPHGLKSTNMSILDARILGRCIEKWGLETMSLALKEFEELRLPVISRQVLHARQLGRLKQGLALHGQKIFQPITARPEEYQQFRQRSMPFFDSVPII